MGSFDSVIGEQLSSVIFVQDYLQLDFDGQTMNYYAWPTLKSGTIELMFPHPNYRNFLCEFIAKLVAGVNDVPDTLFEIVFEDGSSILLDLTCAAGEVIFYTLNEGRWGVIEI